MITKTFTTIHYIKVIFIAMFFFSLHIALTSYVNSTFMESMGWTNSLIDIIYILSSLGTLGAYLIIPRLMRTFGNREVTISLLIILGLTVLGILLVPSIPVKIILFILLLILNFLIIYEMDVFLEHFSSFNNTGKIRGLFFVIINSTWALSPFIAGQIIENFGIRSVYFLAVTMIIITALIFASNFKTTQFLHKPKRKLSDLINTVRKNTNLKNIFLLSMTLHFFYAVAVIYMPLYLYTTIGFSWAHIGILLLLANVPFLVLGYPVGKIADEYIGEKEMMMGGLVVAAIGVLGFIITDSISLVTWAIVLIISRIGISVLETTTESYFFKKMDRDDNEIISIQRNAIPLAYLIVPLLAFIINIFSQDYRILFAGVIIVLLLALYPASQLEDTK